MTAVETELIELERQYWQAIKDHDPAAVARLTDDPCILAGAQGLSRVESKGLAAMLERAPYTLRSFELKDVQVRLLRDDVAIVAYKVHEELTVDGKPITVEASDTSTWVRRRDRCFSMAGRCRKIPRPHGWAIPSATGTATRSSSTPPASTTARGSISPAIRTPKPCASPSASVVSTPDAWTCR